MLNSDSAAKICIGKTGYRKRKIYIVNFHVMLCWAIIGSLLHDDGDDDDDNDDDVDDNDDGRGSLHLPILIYHLYLDVTAHLHDRG